MSLSQPSRTIVVEPVERPTTAPAPTEPQPPEPPAAPSPTPEVVARP